GADVPHEHLRVLSRDAFRAPPHAARRFDHQHRLDHRARRQQGADRLFGDQGGDPCVHEVARAEPRAGRHPRELRRSRTGMDSPQPGRAGGRQSRRAVRCGRADGPTGATRGDRTRLRVLREQRGFVLRHRARAAAARRRDDGRVRPPAAMTSRVSQALVESLAAHREDGPVLSLYMPTALEVDERRQNEIRLKNLLRQARSRLETLGMAGTGAQALTERVDKAPLEREMWQAHGRGFAVFSGRDLLAHAALPFRVRELVVASPRFQLRPLIEALARQRRFWLLAMSQKDVRLYRGDEKALTEVDTGSHLPRSLVEVAGREPTGKELYFHSANRGGEAASFHGTGAGKDDVEPEQEQFVRAVATGLEHFLKQDDSPVILAADNQLRALYARVSSHADRVLDEIDGNVEHVPEESLHAEAWRRMEAELERRRDTELYRLGNSGPELPVSAD